MDITGNWQVRRRAVMLAGADSHGITDWGVYVDGCLTRVVRPHIQACLELMSLTAQAIRPGTASPFFTVVDTVSRKGRETMRAFGELFAERQIVGQYCDEPGRAMFIEWHQPAKIMRIDELPDCYRVYIRGNDRLHLGSLSVGIASCTQIYRHTDRRFVDLTVTANSPEELKEWLRLIGNIGGIRWDRQDTYTLALLGEPLL